MRTLAVLLWMLVLLAVGIRLLYAGFQELVVTQSSPAMAFLSLFTGVVCLVAGLISGVLFLKSEYRT